VRVGAAHYTTAEEIDRFLEAVAAIRLIADGGDGLQP
jgi:selenocysteine lyase/cysteine desulfurase